MKKDKLVEITRSFSMKKNKGNYETEDYFCSQKAECYESEAKEVSENLYKFCKEQVLKSYNGDKIDFSKLAENLPDEHFKIKKLSADEQEDKREADEQKEIDNKQEIKYAFAGKNENGSPKFEQIN